MKALRIIFSLNLILISIFSANAQAIRYNFDSTQQRYIGLSGYGQFWLRRTDLNPGSIVNGKERPSFTDISIRRLRLKLYGQLTNNLGIVLQVGQNNLNTNNKESEFKILDAYTHYKFARWLNVGLGKSAWTGLSRYAAPSTSTLLSSDIFYNSLPVLNIYDDMMRRPSVFAFGQIKKLDYRVILAQPYLSAPTTAPESTQTQFANNYSSRQVSWYIKYQLKDKENQGPFAPATYTNGHQVLSLGIGQLHQDNATWYLLENDTIFHSMKLAAIDIFGHMPLGNKTAITFYGMYLDSNLGKNFLRYLGPNSISNTGSKNISANGPGSRAPVIGTGEVIMAQVGILIPMDILKLQPSFSLQYADYEALDDKMVFYDLSLNAYFDMHSKITLGYQNRPVYENIEGKITEQDRRGLCLLQYQYKFGY